MSGGEWEHGGHGESACGFGEFTGDDGVRQPGGKVHAWTPGTNQTLCGLALSRFPSRRNKS
ncbi:hypothetical protein Aca07nite_69370 [Actinoplanes capillaceus]|uniref:Uncharacterized protein n=1 Tax=Actinoplanes campanulatus TaxID=113559 RepID=A0ABQ3WTT0_9ACTN|nr:hypothetical protein [Actinoplanes capillaceus]GID49662.1 hypothetical protein Aca07nite_69370 [Actinoplanes capillaceus]